MVRDTTINWTWKKLQRDTTSKNELNKLHNKLGECSTLSEEDDQLEWIGNTSKIYSIQSGYKSIILFPKAKVTWNNIWKANCIPKMKTFMWLVFLNKVLTWNNLTKRCFQGPNMCTFFSRKEEKTSHLFMECTLSCKMWEG